MVYLKHGLSGAGNTLKRSISSRKSESRPKAGQVATVGRCHRIKFISVNLSLVVSSCFSELRASVAATQLGDLCKMCYADLCSTLASRDVGKYGTFGHALDFTVSHVVQALQ
jgi:hypothetical protein